MQSYKEILNNGVVIVPTEAKHAEQLEALQKVVFPTLSAEELMKAEHYYSHLNLFPEGQFVALDGDKVIGMTSTMRYSYDLEHPHHHTFLEVIDGGFMTKHEPNGDWLYGLDMGVMSAYRGYGIARALYRARQVRAKELGLKGQITGGMMSGYGAIKEIITATQYLELLKVGKIKDPTVSAQMAVGFEIRGLLSDYLLDPVCANYCALLVLDVDKKV
jgi:GNAT superfamily N-acetyltransferase